MKALNNVIRKYYKYQISPWTRPNLTENGRFYYSDFAVFPNRENSNYMPSGFGGKAWQAFDGDTTTGWGTYSQSASKHQLTMFSKVPICITQLNLTFATSSAGGTRSHIYVSGSNDNVNYTQIYDMPKSSTSKDLTLDINNSEYYNFYFLDIRTPGGDNNDAIGVYECKITATQKTIIEGSSSDYDFYEDIYKYYLPFSTTRKYYKYIYETWQQPTLSDNGILDGTTLAVSASQEYSTYYAYKAFDNSNSSFWCPIASKNPADSYIVIYNPIPLNVTSISVKNRSSANLAVTGGIIYGSNDNTTWTELTTFTNSTTAASAVWTINLSNNFNSYKYHKFYITSGQYTSSSSLGITQIDLTAIQRKTIESTMSDYDYYEDVNVYKAIIE